MTATTTLAREKLRALIERVERLEEEKKATGDDIKQVFAEAKSEGFDTKVLRRIIRLRKQDANERAEEDAVLDTYMHALGMADEAGVFASIGALASDSMSRDKVIDAFKQLVPAHGEVIVKVGGEPVRISRAADGAAIVEPYKERAPAEERPGKSIHKPAPVLSMVPGGKGPSKDEIKRIADDAEKRSKEKQPSDEPEPVE